MSANVADKGNVAVQGGYLPTSHGQIHYLETSPSGQTNVPDLLCLHPAPYSGEYYRSALPYLGGDRRVIAPDYPGYGGSSPLAAQPAIGDYADSLAQAFFADDSTTSGSVDIVGFHSGCLVAAELALLAPARVRRLVLIDVPCFDAATRDKMREKVAKPLPLERSLDCLTAPWEFNVGSRDGIVSLERSLELFADQLRAGTRSHYCFDAAFRYDCDARLPLLECPVTVVATTSPLTQATHAAAALLPNATLIELPDITTSVFEQNVAQIAQSIDRILRND